MRKLISSFIVFLLSLPIIGPNKSSTPVFVETSGEALVTETSAVRNQTLDISSEPTSSFYNLELNQNIGGELSYQNTSCFYKFTASNDGLTRLKLYHNYTYNRGVTCDVYKKMGDYSYYLHLFSYESSTDSTSSDFPEVPYFAGETFLYRIKDKDGPSIRFSVLGFFEEISNTNVLSFDYINGYFKSFSFNLNEQGNVAKTSTTIPESAYLERRSIISNVYDEPYRNIAKLNTMFPCYDIENNIAFNYGPSIGSAYLLKNNIIGTAAHCIISGFYSGSQNNNTINSEIYFGKWISRPTISLGKYNNISVHTEILPTKAFLSKEYYFQNINNYQNFDWAFLTFDEQINESGAFEIYIDNGSTSSLELFKTSTANGYPGSGICGGNVQYEADVLQLSRESIYILQYFANVEGGQSGGPLYFKMQNKYYVIGPITGKIDPINYSVVYRIEHLNLYNYIISGGV